MGRAFWILLIVIYSLPLPARSQQSQDVPSLFAQLNQTSTTDRATRHILEAASKDSTVRQQAAERLPEMINKPDINEIWLNAVRLAGKLKVLETVPSLQKAFLRGQLGRPVATTMGAEGLLNDDVVAKALSEIGDPTLPAVSGFLKSAAPKMRRRAVLILMNIDSSASRSLLLEHLPSETDPRIRGLIKQWQDNLGQ